MAALRLAEDLDDDPGDRATPLSGTQLLEVHRIVTEGTLDDPRSAGRIQDDDTLRVSVFGDGDQVLHRPPPVADLPGRMAALCSFANDDSATTYVPPALRAIMIHFMMGYDHYFEDGNGRTARAIFYWSMLRQGFWLAEFLTISRILKGAPARYARSFLLTEQDDGDLTYFLQYHLEVIHRAIDELREHLARKADELRAVQIDMRALPGEFNYRQLALVERAVKDPSTVFTARSHGSSHGTTTETARQDLSALEARGLLLRSKSGKQFVWRAVPDLVQRLTSQHS